MSIAFFDFDKTLISRNSGSLWLRHELRAGLITWRTAARASMWLARYNLGLSGLDEAVLEAIALLRDTEEAPLRERTWRFYDDEVQHLYRPGARAALAQHREQGERLVLLTTSSLYIAERAAEQLGLDDVLCSRFELGPDGRFTGLPAGPLCFGEGKRLLAAEYAESKGVPMAETAFYTDSALDLPALRSVGRPVAVNPDPRLRREAKRLGWPVVDWGVPD